MHGQFTTLPNKPAIIVGWRAALDTGDICVSRIWLHAGSGPPIERAEIKRYRTAPQPAPPGPPPQAIVTRQCQNQACRNMPTMPRLHQRGSLLDVFLPAITQITRLIVPVTHPILVAVRRFAPSSYRRSGPGRPGGWVGLCNAAVMAATQHFAAKKSMIGHHPTAVIPPSRCC